ncbi:hypothetical protein C3L33_01967, partial [Rhododendron williamsianum]
MLSPSSHLDQISGAALQMQRELQWFEIVLHNRLSWIGIPIVLFSGIPVMIFMFPQATNQQSETYKNKVQNSSSLMAKKHNTTPGGLDNARQSMKEESIESQSTDTTTTSDDSDNTQEPPNLELEGSPSMIGTPNNFEMETPVEEPETSPGNEEGLGRERIQMTLYKLLHKGDWGYVNDYLEQHPDALTTQISLTGDTALHMAVLGGHVKIVEELVHMISAKDLALPNRTALQMQRELQWFEMQTVAAGKRKVELGNDDIEGIQELYGSNPNYKRVEPTPTYWLVL